MFWLILLGVLGGIISLYTLLIAGVAWFSVRPPRMPQFVTPGLMGERHDTVSIPTSDGHTLRAWWVPTEGDTTVIFAHGYFTNRCEFVPFVSRFRRRGASCLFFDHRAHGTSTGTKCTFGLDEATDVRAVVKWVKERRPDDRIVLVGNSMGGVACAVSCAGSPLPVDALVLDSPYARVGEAAKGWWTFFARGRFKRFLRPASIFGRVFTGADLKQVDLPKALSRIRNIPVLLLFASQDPLVPRESALECISAAGPLGEAVWFDHSNHARARFNEHEKYADAVFQFLESRGFVRADPPDLVAPRIITTPTVQTP